MHSHSHGHNHSHNDEGASKRIGWAFFLNLTFTVVEFIGGWLTNSTAIMADAIHDLGDSISIGMSWVLNKLSNKPASNRFSYGYKRFSLLGALINGLVLTVGSIFILIEAIPRLANPEMPQVEGMLLLAIFGMLVNGYAAYKLSHGKTLNERVLNWHLLEDVLGWVAIFVVSIILMFVDWPILDPILSICFTLFILFNVLRTLKSTLMLFLQAAPDIELIESIKSRVLSKSIVGEVHHLHIWSLDGENNVLTAHIVLNTEISNEELKAYKLELRHELKEFDFAHTTIEIEFLDEQCRDASH
ncbi:cation diffusion facilitator family transporter [Catenovulum agarivorans DS-2]|uniref:Cation diffusion facilitator family transporter n=1 Tax=Catenovulum agarivorans DS-2 TaxID=1328313 RepID=W7QCG7_9ALTE|nr:cation diffusion facilitator family transporter [Catenovulum agarivorans]EWH10584.1 cation diffusion facilitator family transporter [Catenovulum agarivorans DS-2]